MRRESIKISSLDIIPFKTWGEMKDRKDMWCRWLILIHTCNYSCVHVHTFSPSTLATVSSE